MWLDWNQFPVKESLVCGLPTETQVKNQCCLQDYKKYTIPTDIRQVPTDLCGKSFPQVALGM
jgi:hypothetical protein